MNDFADVRVHEINGASQNAVAPQNIGELLASGGVIQQIRSSHSTAVSVQRKRTLDDVIERCRKEAEYAGQTFWYSWQVKQKLDDGSYKKVPIEGHTIGLAEAIARNWGNCAAEVYLTEEKTGHYIFNAIFVDLETGANFVRPFKQTRNRKLSEKMEQGGSAELARQDDISFQIGASKALRNVILEATPRFIQDMMMDTAKKSVAKNLTGEGLKKAIAEAIDYFKSKYSVSQEQLEAYLEAKPEAWTASDIVDLRGVIQALKEGRETVDKIFPKVTEGGALSQTVNPTTPASSNGSTVAGGSEGQVELTNDQLKEIQFITKGIDALARHAAEKGSEFNGAETLQVITNDETIGTIKKLCSHPDLISKVATAIGGMCNERGIVVK